MNDHLNELPFDKFHEECGVFGIYGNKDAVTFITLGLHALQHRGQESAGIVTIDGAEFNKQHSFGKVGDRFNKPEIIERLKGDIGIGHNRYSTSGDKGAINIQPIYAETSFGKLAIAHNGNLTNADKIKKNLVAQGSIFSTTMDSEVIIHLLSTSKKPSVRHALIESLVQVKGGYSLVCASEGQLIGVRDPHGIRPLVLGKLGDAYMLASETVAFDIVGAEYVRDIEPAEMVTITDKGIESAFPFGKENKKRFCIFEYVYFSRPDSFFEGNDIYQLRKNMGKQLAHESGVDIDMVVPVPDSGIPAAIGFAEESGKPFDLGIIRNHYIGRTFIEPTDSIRHLGVKLKHNANNQVIGGKNIVLVDDSLVRGTTSKKIVEMVRAAGAKEVHMCISAPPTTNPCFYGVDTPSKDQLLASRMSLQEMKDYIGVDSLTFLSIDGLYKAVTESSRNDDDPKYCDACFTGDYPVAVGE